MTTIAQSIEKNILQIFRTTQTWQHVYAENDAQVITLSEWNNNHITEKEERLFSYWDNTNGKSTSCCKLFAIACYKGLFFKARGMPVLFYLW